MRLFWKLFCSMVMITALACSVGGFVLIDGQFRTSLSAQAEMVMTENALLRRTFLRELQFSGNLDEEGAVQLAERTAAAAEERGLRFRLADSRGQPLVGSHLPGESALSQSLGRTGRAGRSCRTTGATICTHPAPWCWMAEWCIWRTGAARETCLRPGKSSTMCFSIF